MRASSLLGACGISSVLAAGCALPERSNLHDPAKAPSATVRVLREQAALLEAERQEGLTIEVAVRDPQKNPLQVTLSLEDPRDEASPACPRFDPVDLGTHQAVSGSSLTLAWNVFPPPCFERASAEEPARMALEVRAEIRDSAGYKAVATTPFVLRNAVPVADPGPPLWVDPASFLGNPITTITAARSVDADRPYDPQTVELDYSWTQIAGPELAELPASTETVELDLGSDPGVVFTLQLTVCDPWDCSAPQLLDVHAAKATWMVAGDGIALLDASWAEARQFLEPAAGAAPVNLPAASELAPSGSGVWVISHISTSVRMLRSNFLLERAALPANVSVAGGPAFGGPRPSVLGWNAQRSVAWIRSYDNDTGLYGVLELADGSPITTVPVPSIESVVANVVTAAAQHDSTTPLWTMGRDFVSGSGFLLTKTQPVGTFTLPFAGVPGCFEDVYNVEFLAAPPDGTVWAQSDDGIVHIDVDGQTVLDCIPSPLADASAAAHALVLTPNASLGDLLAAYASHGAMAIEGGEILPGPQSDVMRGGVGYDRLRNRVIVASNFSIEAFDAGEYGSEVADIAVQESLSSSFQNLAFALDDGGRPHEISTYYFGDPVQTGAVRLPHSLSLFRTRHRNNALGTVFDDDRLASVDSRTGRVWIARAAAAGGWEAVAFDERGPADDAPVPLPGIPREILFDTGNDTRPAGLWIVTEIAAAPALARVDLAGTVLTTFGQGTGSLPVLPAYPRRLAVDVFDGTLWGTIDALGAPDDGAYHFGVDGTHLRANANPVAEGNGIDGEAFIDLATGNYWYGTNFFSGSQQQHVVRTTTLGVQTATNVTASCGAAATGRIESVRLDTSADQVTVVCVDAGSQEIVRVIRLNRTSLALVTPSIVVAAQSGVPARATSVSTVDGTIWAPHGTAILFLDRFGNEVSDRALPLTLVRPIRH